MMLFSLKLQRDNQQKALTVDSAKGKTGKRLYFSPHCGDEITTYSDRAFVIGFSLLGHKAAETINRLYKSGCYLLLTGNNRMLRAIAPTG